MTDLLIRASVIAAAVVATLLVWRKLHRGSFWLLVGFPLRALVVYGTWRSVASGCGLARRRKRWRWTFGGFPGLGG
ncbi:hypothetical protein GCM10023194_40840 [Planotetraspora phitsanulokensis]|uniref:Uncharacterized protein n=1 Tax=Planotetraspora phitsanulokensis TaxID=575192 RepID=A0A8J3U949_9ACTN|nr:hypothetical protein [Planotetraspora phitsanulokensis]GII40928.1 hypothetical protein Pph01_59310 [Planotetraspora phitsanulokensis]